jgi:23S rRNA (uridine2552-2'-O)-methyltransferase
MRLTEAKRDWYRKKAKEEGYRSRSAYKLIDIQRRYKIIKKGMKVIDFGCAPGGWLQVACREVGNRGLVIGIDLKDVKPITGNCKLIKEDVFKENIKKEISDIAKGKVDVILSDLSPNLSGIWEVDHAKQIELTERVVELSNYLLKEGGDMVLKVFEGEMLQEFIKSLKNKFKVVKIDKPKASRKKSSELYLVCLRRIS